MKKDSKITRRHFMSSVSLVAIGLALFSKPRAKPEPGSGFVIVNGWVLNANEAA